MNPLLADPVLPEVGELAKVVGRSNQVIADINAQLELMAGDWYSMMENAKQCYLHLCESIRHLAEDSRAKPVWIEELEKENEALRDKLREVEDRLFRATTEEYFAKSIMEEVPPTIHLIGLGRGRQQQSPRIPVVPSGELLNRG